MPENDEKIFPNDAAIENFVASLSFEDCLMMLLTMIDIGKAERERKRREVERAAEETAN